jgi:hypothetical protein
LNSCRKTSFIGWLSPCGAESFCAGAAGAAGTGSASAGWPGIGMLRWLFGRAAP